MLLEDDFVLFRLAPCDLIDKRYNDHHFDVVDAFICHSDQILVNWIKFAPHLGFDVSLKAFIFRVSLAIFNSEIFALKITIERLSLAQNFFAESKCLCLLVLS